MNSDRGYKLLLLGLLLAIPAMLRAQTYGNEWIEHDQQYIRIKVAADGIYKFSYAEMQNAGLPVQEINPRSLQLFHRGQEQAIMVEGESDGVLDAGDFLVFWGKRNDGTLDKDLYLTPDLQPHTYYNLYSDSSAYFLTYSTSGTLGKRMNSFEQTNATNLAKEPYYWEERLTVLASNYSAGAVYGFPGGGLDTYLSYGDEAEGYFGSDFAGSPRDISYTNLTDAYTAGPQPMLRLQLIGRNNADKVVQVSVGPNSTALTTVHTATFQGYKAYTLQETLSWNAVANNQSLVRISPSGNARLAVSFARLRYPRLWKMENQTERTFRLSGSMEARYIEIEGVPANAVIYDISNSNQLHRVAYQREGGLVKAMIPGSAAIEQVLFITMQQKSARSSKIIKFRKIPDTGANYIMVSHQRLMKSAGGYDNPVKAYAAYRASAQGGGYDTLLVEMQELYDQFSYGENTPVAIRKFVEYASQKNLPQYLFLVGKALLLNYNYYRSANWNNINRDLVPTFGWPAADIPFVAQLRGSGYAPAFPVGRFSARTPDDVAAYLNKVIEDETAAPKGLWQKRLVHLGGGANAFEAQMIKNYLKSWEFIARGPYLGGKVTTLSKSEDVVVEEVDISKDVNRGVRLVTFFGHSGPYATDMEISFASDPRAGYNNKGLYPRFLINGCNVGNAFGTSNTFMEDWLYTPDKGGLNFIAHSGNGYSNLLYQYSTQFYRVAMTDDNLLGASIGRVQQEAVRRFLNNVTVAPLQITQAQQMILQGDPALQLFKIEKPDFETKDELLSAVPLNNQPFNLSADSIAIGVVVRNLGKVVLDSLPVQLEYWLNENTPRVLELTAIPAVYYQDTIYLHVGTNQLDGSGISNFRVTLNPESNIEEYDYTNNTGALQVLIPAGGTVNVLPFNYAVVKKSDVTLFTRATDLLYPVRAFHLQLDTAYQYNSAALQETTINSRTLVSWQLSLPQIAQAPADTIVYFWKSRLAVPDASEDPSFAKSSFTYIKEAPEGWAQAHEGQFTENKLTSLDVMANRSWAFNPVQRNFQVTTFGASTPGSDFRNTELMVDNVQYILNYLNRICNTNSINAIQFDKNTLGIPFAQIRNGQNPQSCGRTPQLINNFQGGDIIYGNNDSYNLERYLSSIPEGDWMLLFSIGTNNYKQWPASVKQQVQNLGVDANILNQLENGDPIIILGKKGGAPGTAQVVLADKSAGNPPANQQVIQLASTVTGTNGVGYVESALIGPAANWQDVAIRVKEDATDTWSLAVVGVNAQNQETILQELSTSQTLQLNADATTYPYLRLRLQVKDEEGLTPPQLKFWRVGFETLPEGVLLVSDTVSKSMVVNEGQLVQPGFKFVNISENSFAADSLEVRSSLFNLDRRSTREQRFKIISPAPGDTSRFALKLNTNDKTGYNDLLVKVNQKPGTEVSLQNNVLDARKFLMVRADSLHPFIDVAFDGSYITNGEIVSPNPLISVIMRDENKIKIKQDTTGIHLYLKRQCESCAYERINLNNPNVRFYPATRQEDCRIEFTPGPLEDGFYTLQVQVQDASGNKAGTRPYAISFEVISESGITNFYPYPNPFSSSTRFVFTLTGNEVPEDLKIQIMTVSGKVVREIMKEELGLHIGNNISNYAWDGTDEWGDRLANGVYLYRVVLGGSNVQEWKHRATKGDKAFKQSWGKLYILR